MAVWLSIQATILIAIPCNFGIWPPSAIVQLATLQRCHVFGLSVGRADLSKRSLVCVGNRELSSLL